MICDECELLLRALASLNCEGLLWESVTLCLPIPLVPVMYPWVCVVTENLATDFEIRPLFSDGFQNPSLI